MTMRTSNRAFVAVVVALCTMLTQAAQPERERIAAERAAAMARFAEQERRCSEQFVVTSCADAARKEHRLTLARLHRAELALNEAERRETAARRRQMLQQKASGQDARASEPERAAPQRERTRTAPEPNPPAPVRPPRSASSVADPRAPESRNEAAFEARARAAQAHRETVERRNAQRAAQGKVAAPLPVPSGASAP